jgi:uncharacterized protein DUF6925
MSVPARTNHLSEAGAIVSFLAAQLSDCETQWSLGTFGALAEFTCDAGEPAAVSLGMDALSVVTARGGIRLTPRADMRLFASESVTRANWGHRVALCLPEYDCRMSRRRALTELGPDRDALWEQDRDAILFDLGLDALQMDACIRVADLRVAAELRALAGRAVFEYGNPAMSVILAASPHRVFMSKLGRIEVFAPIPPPNGKSPEGPHTHLLPKLLQAKRTHAATEAIPNSYVPCAHLYPAHPLKDSLGHELAYDARRHESFQEILHRFGDPDAIELKKRVMAAVAKGEDPAQLRVPNDRHARAGIRVALRQMLAANEAPAALSAWIVQCDRTHAAELDDEADVHQSDQPHRSSHAP